jgi:CRISPR-associated protein Csm3
MKLKEIKEITATVEIVTGLHIGGNNDEIKIGGIDTPVIKNPLTNEPYIPGSSLKGKIRSLIEWQYGAMTNDGKPADITKKNDELVKRIVKLFGNGSTIKDNNLAKVIGPTRVSFADASLLNKDELWEKNALTEEKIEVTIDRLKGSAKRGGLRHMERVPAGARFSSSITLLKFENDEDLESLLALGMKLLELTNLGGSGSRGYGKIKFENIQGLSDKYLNNGELKSYKELLSLVGN